MECINANEILEWCTLEEEKSASWSFAVVWWVMIENNDAAKQETDATRSRSNVAQSVCKLVHELVARGCTEWIKFSHVGINLTTPIRRYGWYRRDTICAPIKFRVFCALSGFYESNLTIVIGVSKLEDFLNDFFLAGKSSHNYVIISILNFLLRLFFLRG